MVKQCRVACPSLGLAWLCLQVIINLQKTALDSLSSLRIFGKSDQVMSMVLLPLSPPPSRLCDIRSLALLLPPPLQIILHRLFVLLSIFMQ